MQGYTIGLKNALLRQHLHKFTRPLLTVIFLLLLYKSHMPTVRGNL